MKVSEIRPDSSGVTLVSLRLVRESSYMPLADAVALNPGESSGRVVLMLMVAPMPPVGMSARPLLNTSTLEMPSEARLAKSNDRPRPVPLTPPAVGIWRPFSVTRLKSGPKPRTVTRAPSPRSRSMDTPVMRCSDSARFVSGKLPMSSAVMASTTPKAFRLRSIEASRLARMPVTTISSSSAGCSSAVCANPGASVERPRASAIPRARGF